MARDNADYTQLGSHLDDPQSTDVQPVTTSQGSTALPVETIYHILCLVGPQDLVHLRAVSKLFREIIHEPAFWRTVYATARLPLPPGPFPWQSTHFLQRTLVYSARLANTWTTEPLTLISRKIYTGPRSIDEDRFQWVCGRWLIVSKDMKQLRSRDVETGSERVLWDHGSFANWGSTSVVISQGHFIYVAVHLGRGRLADPVKLLEFVVDDDTGYLSGPEMFDVPTCSLPREAFVPRIRVDSGIAPYAYISLDAANKPRHSLVFDPSRRRFYKFPRFRTRLDILLNYRGAWLPHLVEVYFTRTHLFVLSRSYLIHGNIGEVEVVQTFALPDVDSTPASNPGLVDSDSAQPIVRELRLTHEMVTRDMGSMWLAPIRDATVDPITRSTTLRFMHTYAPFYPTTDMRVRLVCTNYTLPAFHTRPISATATATATAADGNDNDNNDNDNNSNRNSNSNNSGLNAIVRSTEEVLPITITSHDIFSVPGLWKGNLVDVSNDGFVRGCCMVGQHTVAGAGASAGAGAGTGTGTGAGAGAGAGASAGTGAEDTGTEDGGSDNDDTRAPVPDGMIHKFTVDATGERCVAVVGDRCPPWADLDASRHYEYSLDGMRGKIWCTKGGVLERNAAGELIDRDVLAVVVDFK